MLEGDVCLALRPLDLHAVAHRAHEHVEPPLLANLDGVFASLCVVHLDNNASTPPAHGRLTLLELVGLATDLAHVLAVSVGDGVGAEVRRAHNDVVGVGVGAEAADLHRVPALGLGPELSPFTDGEQRQRALGLVVLPFMPQILRHLHAVAAAQVGLECSQEAVKGMLSGGPLPRHLFQYPAAVHLNWQVADARAHPAVLLVVAHHQHAPLHVLAALVGHVLAVPVLQARACVLEDGVVHQEVLGVVGKRSAEQRGGHVRKIVARKGVRQVDVVEPAGQGLGDDARDPTTTLCLALHELTNAILSISVAHHFGLVLRWCGVLLEAQHLDESRGIIGWAEGSTASNANGADKASKAGHTKVLRSWYSTRCATS
mmetsp:Transcript_83788/g.194930  ORF Transcript_83788/g.194930 Transcript_83788/m.194930 type:complete len:372 (+) Transcript_83788:189-1304(+)